MRRQREDGSGLGNLHDGLGEEARSPGSCTSTRAAGCSLRGSAQILRLTEKRCALLMSVRVVLLDYGENVRGEREGQLVDCRQARQNHWRHKGVTKQKQRIVVGVVLVVDRAVGRGRGAALDGQTSGPTLTEQNGAPRATRKSFRQGRTRAGSRPQKRGGQTLLHR